MAVVAEGVDYAFGTHPSPAALLAAGKSFVVRYGGPGTEDKWIHADEARALAASGIWIVANAEGSSGGLKAGFSAGVAWATSALAWFRSIGMPKGRPIYFSVDFDTTSGDWAVLDAAMDGAASVIGRECVGVYGEYSIVAHLIGNGKATWAWETYAWSGQQWFAGNHLEQYHNGVTIDGADCDLDRAMQADYGQWMPGLSYAGDDMNQKEHNWLYNMAQTVYAISQGQDSVDVVDADTGNAGLSVTDPAGKHKQLDLTPFWARLAAMAASSGTGATLDAESLAAAMRAILRDEINKTGFTGKLAG